MKPLSSTILILLIAVAVPADETLYRYEGDVLPLDPSAGWEEFNPCDPPCSEFLEDGHFVRLGSEADDFASYGFWIAQPPEVPPPRCGSSGASAPTFRWDRFRSPAMPPLR